MNPALNGIWPVQAAPLEKRFVILATDRHRCGQPVLALSEGGEYLGSEIGGRKFVRFATQEERGVVATRQSVQPGSVEIYLYSYYIVRSSW